MYKFDGKHFFPHQLKGLYESTGLWPSVGVDVGDDVFIEFSGSPPEYSKIGVDDNGFPCWVAVDAIDFDTFKIEVKSAVQAYMDSKAREYGYDDIKSAVTYAEEESVAKFQKEGKAFRCWRSMCWDYCFKVIESCDISGHDFPSPHDVVSEMPDLNI